MKRWKWNVDHQGDYIIQWLNQNNYRYCRVRHTANKKGKLRKTKTLNNINLLICIRHFDCRCTSSNTSNIFVYNHLKTTAAIVFSHLPYMDNNVTYRNNRITSSDDNVFWRHLTSFLFWHYDYWRLQSHVTCHMTWRYTGSQSGAILILIGSRVNEI